MKRFLCLLICLVALPSFSASRFVGRWIGVVTPSKVPAGQVRARTLVILDVYDDSTVSAQIMDYGGVQLDTFNGTLPARGVLVGTTDTAHYKFRAVFGVRGNGAATFSGNGYAGSVSFFRENL